MSWLVNYGGWIPVLGILPPPHRDRTDRQATMIVAHLVYGAVLGALAAPAPAAGDAVTGDSPDADLDAVGLPT